MEIVRLGPIDGSHVRYESAALTTNNPSLNHQNRNGYRGNSVFPRKRSGECERCHSARRPAPLCDHFVVGLLSHGGGQLVYGPLEFNGAAFAEAAIVLEQFSARDFQVLTPRFSAIMRNWQLGFTLHDEWSALIAVYVLQTRNISLTPRKCWVRV